MRYNIFNQIHKALRALLSDTLVTVQQTDFSNPAEGSAAIAGIRSVISAFDNHAFHEDHGLLPHIQAYDPALVDAFEQEHVADHALGEELHSLLRAWEQATTPETQLSAGNRILYAFISFMSFNLDHMNREESVLNEQLWKYYTDESIMQISQSIVASIPPQDAAVTHVWMIRGMNNTEITNWLRMVQKLAPAPVFQSLYKLAEVELPVARFQSIMGNLTEGAMVA